MTEWLLKTKTNPAEVYRVSRTDDGVAPRPVLTATDHSKHVFKAWKTGHVDGQSSVKVTVTKKTNLFRYQPGHPRNHADAQSVRFTKYLMCDRAERYKNDHTAPILT